ncbi:uncharacterized protein C8Q71DRAFT_191897 [Rhodofomes roseus]|uniref:Uncharacterized protein n=1 Tax=Rhodofomes roseus TaxID=34475 RepID=A0ABQ8K7X5_9APHY|nr:uncharacterized protein C8Q71DRAFT_191897 [Rhodofomes roseus]KAH9833152.1 hypothetical protein C8Q71DRAFT_191897 [Rhodofomes roseus]
MPARRSGAAVIVHTDRHELAARCFSSAPSFRDRFLQAKAVIRSCSRADMLYTMDDTTVVVLHPDDTQLAAPIAVQVTIKADRPASTDDVAAFFHAQREVSNLVTRVITAHLQHPLPSPMCFQGESYVLTAKHAAWTFGSERVRFSWGPEEIKPGREKWTFIFASLKP